MSRPEALTSGFPSLAALEIHVWPVNLAASPETTRIFWSMLSEEERGRAEQFQFEHLKNAYLVSHGILRSLIACYSDVSATEVHFRYLRNGKPVADGAASDLRFNLSHSGRLALYAFTRACEVGIDVEQIRVINDVTDIARQCFCAEEFRDLNSLESHCLGEAFFACWTRKEAFLKGTGDGLTRRLDSFRVTLRPGDFPAIVHISGDAHAASRWAIKHFTPAKGYVAALAYAARGATVRLLPCHAAEELLSTVERYWNVPPAVELSLPQPLRISGHQPKRRIGIVVPEFSDSL